MLVLIYEFALPHPKMLSTPVSAKLNVKVTKNWIGWPHPKMLSTLAVPINVKVKLDANKKDDAILPGYDVIVAKTRKCFIQYSGVTLLPGYGTR